MPPLSKISLLIAVPTDGCPCGQPLRTLAHELDDLRDRACFVRGDVDPGEHLPVHQWVGVSVNEAGHDRGSWTVDADRDGPDRRFVRLSTRPDGPDHASGAEHRLGARTRVIDQ